MWNIFKSREQRIQELVDRIVGGLDDAEFVVPDTSNVSTSEYDHAMAVVRHTLPKCYEHYEYSGCSQVRIWRDKAVKLEADAQRLADNLSHFRRETAEKEAVHKRAEEILNVK